MANVRRVLLLSLLLLSGVASARAKSLAPAFGPLDLGTLGGLYGSCSVFAINASGQVTGNSTMPGGNNHAFRWSAQGGMVDLGSLGGTVSVAGAINSLGAVVGGASFPGDLIVHGFYWTPGSPLVDMGTLPGLATASYNPSALNTNGVAVGTCFAPDGTSVAFTWSKATGIKKLVGLGGTINNALAINSSGVAVGTSQNAAGAFRAVEWTATGAVKDLGDLGGGSASATDINDNGQITGQATNTFGVSHAFLWQKGKMTDLGSLAGPAESSGGAHINALGHVVGISTDAAQVNTRVFLWTPQSGLRDLGALETGADTNSPALNDNDQVVGTSGFQNGWRAFSWTAAGGMVNLGAFEGSSYGVAVNNLGQIIGTAESPVGTRSFLTTSGAPLQDLGTLAGGRSAAYAASNLGEVVGESVASDRLNHGFYWTPNGGMVDLGTIGQRHARAIGINQHGEVIVQTGNQLPSGERPFYWSQATGRIEIPGLGGDNWEVVGINNFGQVAGNSFSANGDFHATLWSRTGGLIDLDGVVGSTSIATAINDDGTVVGTHGNAMFLWKQGVGMKDLPSFGGFMLATSINNNGLIAGWGGDAVGNVQVFTFKGHLTGLGWLGTGDAQTLGLNNSGVVVGRSFAPASNQVHAFAGASAPLRDLGTLPGNTYSEARGVSDLEDVIGVSGNTDFPDPSWHAFIVHGSGGMLDLGTLGGAFSQAMAVNSAGQAVGQAQRTDGGLHAALWNTR